MLELVNITKDYKVADTKTTVLKGISLTFRNHEFISILGQSGCGKTTMLNIIGGLDKFTTGDLIINGKSTKKYNDHDWDTYRNHSIGFVFQSYNLIPHQSVLKNVELALSIGGISKKERRQRAIDALVRVGLKDHIKKRPNQLSGGQCQRVSIARALVGNPDIILADEPTGALDTETSVQIMEILKEISKERLVIMVTHNPELAEKYSTRIVRMLDGNIISDTKPVDDNEKVTLLEEVNVKENTLTEKEKKQSQRKSSMSIFTSIALSASNLWTKKSRTLITALACSIGIIGIAVVLSVSTGMHDYVNILERDSSSVNFITVSPTKYQIPTAEDFEGQEIKLEEYPENANGVYPYVETGLAEFIGPLQNITPEYVDYIEKNVHGTTTETDLVLGIDYSRSLDINIVAKYENIYSSKNVRSSWTEVINNVDYIKTQYTVLKSLDGKSIPTEFNELVLVVDKYNRISTKVLESLGILKPSSNNPFEKPTTEEYAKINYDDILGKEVRLILNDDFYKESFKDSVQKNVYTAINTSAEYEQVYDKGIPLKVVAIIRENADATNTWISTGVAYSSALVDYVVEMNQKSKVVEYQINNPNYNVLEGKEELDNSNIMNSNLKKLGAVSTPSSIVFYPKDFESKNKIIEVLTKWNEVEVKNVFGDEAEQYKIEFQDMSKLIAGMLGDLIDIITYALVAFSAISLVVSSIMIAIITYASVIERIKEIGTLRSLGARKRDISAVFIAEAGIIGFVSSILALIATIVINLIINAVIVKLVDVQNIAQLTFSISFWMIVLCVSINLIASLIPSGIAARKDPVVALRTE